jgi:dihydroorotase
MQLVHSGRMSLPDLIARFTIGPARLLGLPKGTLSVGAAADITVFVPHREWA